MGLMPLMYSGANVPSVIFFKSSVPAAETLDSDKRKAMHDMITFFMIECF